MPKFGVPMRMAKTATVVVEAESEDAAAEMFETPRGEAAEEALQHADWRFEGYETDFSWGIEEVSE